MGEYRSLPAKCCRDEQYRYFRVWALKRWSFCWELIEIVAAILLVLGFAVRWVVLALMFVVVVLGLMAMGDAGFLNTMQQLVMSHGYTDMTNNLTEVYLVYFILLLALFFMGAGRWFSLDWYIYRNFMKRIDDQAAHHDPFEIDATDEPGISKQ